MAWNHKTRVVAFAVAIQPTPGAFVTPTAADIVPVSVPTNGESLISAEDPTATGSIWAAPRVFLGRTGSAGATAPLRGPGGTTPFLPGTWPLGRILQAAGFAEVRTAAAVTGSLAAGSSNTALALAAGATALDDFYVGMPIQHTAIGSGTIKGTSLIADYNGTSKMADLAETLGTAPAAGGQYTIPPNVTYQLGTLGSSPPLLSISVWRDKKRYNYRDVRVESLTIDLPVSNEQNQSFPSVEFSLKGLPHSVEDEASPALSRDQLTTIAPFRNGKFTLDRVPLGHGSTRFALQSEVAGASNAWAEFGQDGYEIMSGTRTFDMDINQMQRSDFDIDARVDGQTKMSCMSLWGMGPGNRFGFLVPEIALDPLNNPGDRNGFVNLTGNAAFVGVDKSATLTIWWSQSGTAILGALSLNRTGITTGVSTTINILGATADSVITGTVPAGMTLNSAARTITGTPTTASTTPITLTETLAGATGSPKATIIPLTVAVPASGPLTILALGSSTWSKAFTDGTGPSNPDVTVSTDGQTFTALGTTGTGGTVLGNALATATARPIRFISAAIPSTTLAQWEANGSSQRAAAVAAANAAGDVAAIVVAVGFNDARNTKTVASRAAHLAMLRSFYSKLRSEIGKPNVPIFIETTQKLVDGDATSNPQILMVRSAEMDVLADSNNFLFTHTIDLPQLADNIHQTAGAYTTSSTRGGAAMAAVFAGQTVKRGPRLVSAAAVSDTQTRVTLQHVTGTDFTPGGADVTGFGMSLDDFATILTPLTAVRETATTILITHPSTGTSVVTAKVRYQGSPNPIVTGPILSDTMPAFPADFSADPMSFQTIAAAAGVAKVAQVNFRDSSTLTVQTTNPAGWNAFTGDRDANGSDIGATSTTGKTAALVSTTGAATGWTLTTTGPARGASSNAITGSQPYPADVANSFWVNGDSAVTTPNARIASTTHTLTGLDPAKQYTLGFYGRRETTTARSTTYKAGGQSVTSVNNQYNGAAVTIANLTPASDGSLTYSYEPAGTAQYGYLNAVIITEQ